jgi:hypothetical protein
MNLPWFLFVPLCWLFIRLLLVVPFGLQATRLYEFTKSPFGPNGAIGDKGGGCLMVFLSGAFAAMACGGYLATTVKAPDRATAVIVPVIGGFIALVVGLTLDRWLIEIVQSWISQATILGRLPEVRGWLVDGSDQDKMRAAVVLGHMRKEPFAAEHLADLLKVLRSGNPEVRYLAACAVMSIVQHTHQGPPEMEAALLPLLDDPELKVRAPAARALVESRLASLADVVCPLASALKSVDKTAWGLATWYLDAPGRYTHLAIPDIFAAVAQHGEDGPKSLSLVFRWIDPAGKPALMEGLNHPCPQVRKLAGLGLDRMHA